MLHVKVDFVRNLGSFGGFACLGKVQEGSRAYQQQADNETLEVRHVEYGHANIVLSSRVGIETRTAGSVAARDQIGIHLVALLGTSISQETANSYFSRLNQHARYLWKKSAW